MSFNEIRVLFEHQIKNFNDVNFGIQFDLIIVQYSKVFKNNTLTVVFEDYINISPNT